MMQTTTGRLVLALVLTALMPIQTLAQGASTLWTRDHVSPNACKSTARTYGAEPHTTEVQGHKWPHTPGGGIEFIDHTAAHINAAALGRASNGALVERLVTAARSRAFTKLDFEEGGGSSPAYVSAIIVKTTAYAVAYLRSRRAISTRQLTEINQWVAVLSKNARSRAGSQDHKAANVVAALMWAAALGDRRSFDRATKTYLGLLKPLNSKPYFQKQTRYNNEVLHQIIGGAQVLEQNGIDVLGRKQGKYTLDDAVRHHAEQVRQNGAKKLKTASDRTEQARSIFRAQGWGTHLAWIPVYKAMAEPGDTLNTVNALENTLRRVDRNPFWGLQMGVHTGCLFGR